MSRALLNVTGIQNAKSSRASYWHFFLVKTVTGSIALSCSLFPKLNRVAQEIRGKKTLRPQPPRLRFYPQTPTDTLFIFSSDIIQCYSGQRLLTIATPPSTVTRVVYLVNIPTFCQIYLGYTQNIPKKNIEYTQNIPQNILKIFVEKQNIPKKKIEYTQYIPQNILKIFANFQNIPKKTKTNFRIYPEYTKKNNN